ncbi:MAG TPA: recombinase family protein, partial [Chitinophagales bacterium]|nr:recombinase family protein [Chitinophagales bacterium]
VSGKSVMQHPEAKKMLKDVKSGFITGLIFSKVARLARNTRELLDFADIFNACGADLISLQEAIDTSTPAGRMFYTMIAAMAQWEREEIGSRVAASIPIRAKLGKQIAGAPPFGYIWVDKQLQLDPKEAPIRKLMYDLFLEHKRKKTVARLLNERGYRTRNGGEFADTTITRLLEDPIAKGIRRANYTTSKDKGKTKQLKPESEWVILSCPAIISEEVWNRCQEISQGVTATRMPRSKTPTQLFSGFLTCTCGGKMYVASRTDKYKCSKCKQTRIDSADIEEIYFENLKSFLLTKSDLQKFKVRANDLLESKQGELEHLAKEKERIKAEMKNLFTLHSQGQIPTNGFKEFYTPLNTQSEQIDETLIELQAQVDRIGIESLNGEHILDNAENLYERWPTLNLTVKRQIVEELTQSIIIGGEDITIKFGYSPVLLPLIPPNPPKGQRTLGNLETIRVIPA